MSGLKEQQERSPIFVHTQPALRLALCLAHRPLAAEILLKLVKMDLECQNKLRNGKMESFGIQIDSFLAFMDHFLDLRTRSCSFWFSALKLAELTIFDSKYLKTQCEISTFPIVQAWYCSLEHIEIKIEIFDAKFVRKLPTFSTHLFLFYTATAGFWGS